MPSGSGTNPIDKKKKTEEDKPEEQRTKEKKKRNNPKSETDKDEKDRNPHDPDVKKLKVTGYSVFDKDQNRVSTVSKNDPRFAEISALINPEKKSSGPSLEQIAKEVNKQLVLMNKKEKKRKAKEVAKQLKEKKTSKIMELKK